MKKSDFKEERLIDRLLRFVDWAKKGGLVKSRLEFEERCGLSHNYLYNTQFMTKKSIGTDVLRKIRKAFPMINLTWVIMGEGAMIDTRPDEDYKQAYENLLKKMAEMRKILDTMDVYQCSTRKKTES